MDRMLAGAKGLRRSMENVRGDCRRTKVVRSCVLIITKDASNTP